MSPATRPHQDTVISLFAGTYRITTSTHEGDIRPAQSRSEYLHWIPYPVTAFVEDVGIDHDPAEIRVSEES
jgi:hypothetical protein